ncbi:hypothetical protein CGZ93_01530 [Enemella dayhoffiae]|uniref:Uncharacterized protein n=1 Tax=Enemella dayhoffiae TaxID=2016507 RepID=A0A255HFG9_9ACTN|nr:hypothetical protein [Enemella dayhoffiae]OYO25164.1 hypothetical protein CGZ93_01530 [Enemella dayhoffiae]
MNWWLGLFGMVLVLIGWGLRTLSTPAPTDTEDLPADSEVDAAFERVDRELTVSALASRLDPVIRRRVPLRAIRAAPARGATRLGFADGTVILVRSQGGELARLALRVGTESVRLVACRPSGRQAELEFSTDLGTVTALAIGLDQDD